MKFPTMKAEWRFDASTDTPPQWRLTATTRDPLTDKAFVRNVAERHFSDIAELSLLLENTFFAAISPEDVPRSRRRYIQAIGYVSVYLAKRGLPDFLTAELLELAKALGDLDKGTTRPFLKEAKRAGARHLSSDVWEARAFIVMALDHLVQHGDADEAKTAARMSVATEHLFPAVSGPTKSYTGDTIMDWQRAFENRASPSPDAQALYDGREQLAELYRTARRTSDPRAVADGMLLDANLRAARMLDEQGLTETIRRFHRKIGRN